MELQHLLFSLSGASIIVLVLAGCDGPGWEATGPTIRDSAGVQIIEYGRVPSSAALFKVSERPLFEHGAEDAEYAFSGIVTGSLLPDGRVVVGDIGTSEIVFLNAEGGLEAIAGGRGQGPGEIGLLASITSLPNGLIVVEDDGNNRLTLFDNHTPLNTISGRPLGWLRMVTVIGADDSGILLLGPRGFRPEFEEPWHRGAIQRFDLSRMSVDTILQFDFVRRPTGGASNPFTPEGARAVAGGLVVIGRTDRAELRWHNSEGELLRIIRWRHETQFPSEVHWQVLDSMVRERMAGAGSDAIEDMLARWREGATEALPVFRGIVGASNGDVWMGGGTPRADGISEYSVVSSEGEWLGSVTMPRRFRVLHITEDKILGVLRDDLDVERVAVFEIVGRDRGRPGA
jgi:hypothetical protein